MTSALDQIGQLLLDKERPLRESMDDDEVRTLVRARTLTVLSRLDGRRKGTVVQFLYESGLIGWIKSLKGMEKYVAIVDLRGADLRGAVLVEAALIGAELRGVNLSDAKLHEAVLSSADLRGADLRRANLSGADLGAADLSGLDPVAPTFYPPVDRMRYANLSHADLKGAIMVRVDLIGACLDGADLNRADLVHPRAGGPSEEEYRLAEARGLNLSREVTANLRLELMAASLKGATLPNGQKYEDCLNSQGENGENSSSS